VNKQAGCPKCGSQRANHVINEKANSFNGIGYEIIDVWTCRDCGHEFDEPAKVKDETASDN
jgi:ribosomal protein L37AE/L43A